MRGTQRDQKAIDYIVALLYERARIRLHDGKQALIRARLGKRMRLGGFETLVEYCDFLQQPLGQEEVTHAIDALTTNFTSFLREGDHFGFTVSQALPQLLTPGQKSFSLWSAACATGEEPYSLAFYLDEYFPPSRGWDWRILATDISTKALTKARDGIYAEDRMQALPPSWLRKHFQRGQGNWEGYYRVKRAVLERVRFEQMNLLGDYHFADPFQVIFCRNVMIYFDRQTQEQLARHLTRFLVQNGFLLIGHSESLNGLSLPLRCLRPSIYQKV